MRKLKGLFIALLMAIAGGSAFAVPWFPDSITEVTRGNNVKYVATLTITNISFVVNSSSDLSASISQDTTNTANARVISCRFESVGRNAIVNIEVQNPGQFKLNLNEANEYYFDKTYTVPASLFETRNASSDDWVFGDSITISRSGDPDYPIEASFTVTNNKSYQAGDCTLQIISSGCTLDTHTPSYNCSWRSPQTIDIKLKWHSGTRATITPDISRLGTDSEGFNCNFFKRTQYTITSEMLRQKGMEDLISGEPPIPEPPIPEPPEQEELPMELLFPETISEITGDRDSYKTSVVIDVRHGPATNGRVKNITIQSSNNCNATRGSCIIKDSQITVPVTFSNTGTFTIFVDIKNQSRVSKTYTIQASMLPLVLTFPETVSKITKDGNSYKTSVVIGVRNGPATNDKVKISIKSYDGLNPSMGTCIFENRQITVPITLSPTTSNSNSIRTHGGGLVYGSLTVDADIQNQGRVSKTYTIKQSTVSNDAPAPTPPEPMPELIFGNLKTGGASIEKRSDGKYAFSIEVRTKTTWKNLNKNNVSTNNRNIIVSDVVNKTGTPPSVLKTGKKNSEPYAIITLIANSIPTKGGTLDFTVTVKDDSNNELGSQTYSFPVKEILATPTTTSKLQQTKASKK